MITLLHPFSFCSLAGAMHSVRNRHYSCCVCSAPFDALTPRSTCGTCGRDACLSCASFRAHGRPCCNNCFGGHQADPALEQLVAMGFDRGLAKTALLNHAGSQEEALEDLLAAREADAAAAAAAEEEAALELSVAEEAARADKARRVLGMPRFQVARFGSMPKMGSVRAHRSHATELVALRQQAQQLAQEAAQRRPLPPPPQAPPLRSTQWFVPPPQQQLDAVYADAYAPVPPPEEAGYWFVPDAPPAHHLDGGANASVAVVLVDFAPFLKGNLIRGTLHGYCCITHP